MRLDIRLPIGALFVAIGALLTGYGILGDHAIYRRSLGLNVNLWWGLVLLLFGAVFAYFGTRNKTTATTHPNSSS
jgi:hypothetical protein